MVFIMNFLSSYKSLENQKLTFAYFYKIKFILKIFFCCTDQVIEGKRDNDYVLPLQMKYKPSGNNYTDLTSL